MVRYVTNDPNIEMRYLVDRFGAREAAIRTGTSTRIANELASGKRLSAYSVGSNVPNTRKLHQVFVGTVNATESASTRQEIYRNVRAQRGYLMTGDPSIMSDPTSPRPNGRAFDLESIENYLRRRGDNSLVDPNARQLSPIVYIRRAPNGDYEVYIGEGTP